MKSGAHHVVIVTSEYRDTLATIPVPYTDGLVVRSRADPWAFIVEVDSPNVIKVTKQCEDTSLEFVVPDFHLVIITTGNK